MSTFLKILLAILLPLSWNLLTVWFLSYENRKGKLSPIKFAATFSIGYSLVVSAILFIVLIITEGFNQFTIGFVLLVLLLHLFISFPIAYYLSKTHMENILQAIEKLSSRFLKAKEE